MTKASDTSPSSSSDSSPSPRGTASRATAAIRSQWGSLGQRTLRRSIIVAVGGGGVVLLAGAGVFLYARMSADLRDREDARLRDDARRAMLVVDAHLQERHRQAEVLGSMPSVVDAAVEGARRARELGIAGLPIPTLEQRFNDTRTLGISPRTRAFLISETGPLDIAEVMLTDAYGYNAITTEKTSDFVQSDEDWWQDAYQHGVTRASAVYDESAGQVVVSVAAAVRERDDDKPVGVLKLQFGLRSLEQGLSGAASAGTTTFDVLDSAGNVVATTGRSTRMRLLPGAGAIPAGQSAGVITYGGDDGAGALQRAVVQTVNDGAWRLVGHENASVLDAQLADRRQVIFGGLAGVLVLFLIFLTLISRFIEARISAPVAELARVSEAVAAGDLSVHFAPGSADDEIGRLGRAIATMVGELSRLASELQSAGTNTASFATSITQGAEGLSASAQEIASTSNDLSRRVVDMADTIQQMSSDAARLVSIASKMADGAREGVERNAGMRALAQDNRSRLDVSASALEQLSAQVAESAQAIDALAQASEEIRTFVTLVQKMSRQSKLLALNAAMEAARAGEHGQGFAVVANEVRRLAAGASESAERTEGLVRGVLERIAQSRESSLKSVETLAGVREATRLGLESFGHVEQAVGDSERWTSALSDSASASAQLIHEMTQRLGQLATSADSFASAMQEVAATTQEQSASTEEIAAIATSLAGAAERLRHHVATFRLAGATESR